MVCYMSICETRDNTKCLKVMYAFKVSYNRFHCHNSWHQIYVCLEQTAANAIKNQLKLGFTFTRTWITNVNILSFHNDTD